MLCSQVLMLYAHPHSTIPQNRIMAIMIFQLKVTSFAQESVVQTLLLMDMTFVAKLVQSPWVLYQLQNLGLHIFAMLMDVHGQLAMVWTIVAALVQQKTNPTPLMRQTLMAKNPKIIDYYCSCSQVLCSRKTQ